MGWGEWSKRMIDVIVIGGGPAGVTAALRASELGASTLLVERDQMGGTCTNDGCVPTRVLAKAARLMRDAEQCAAYGIEGTAPKLDFRKLMSRTQQVVYQIHEKKQLIHHLEDSGVQVRTRAGAARFVDEHTIALEDGSQLSGRNFILCAGGHPRRLPIQGAEHALTHSDVWSLKSLPQSIAIIGAAATGCQLASIFRAFGAQVHLLDIASHLLPGEDSAVSQEMQQAFETRGIDLYLGIDSVGRISRERKPLQLHFRQMGEEETLHIEAVIFAVGWVGNIEELNLSAANVFTERGYIVVDEALRTSAEHIFAAGDITGSPMLVQSGSIEGRIAAENAVSGAGLQYRRNVVPHGGFTDPEYASVGLTEDDGRAAGTALLLATVPYRDLDRAVIDGHPEGVFKLIVSPESHLILGAHAVGEQAVEIIQIIAAGMASGLSVEQLADLELSYPTFTAIVGLAARRAVHRLGGIALAPQWRTLGKTLAAEWERSD